MMIGGYRGFHFCPPIEPLLLKNSDMEDGIKTMIFWGLMALVAFISAFFIPVIWVKIVNLVFGGVNMLVILSWVISVIQAKREYKKIKKMEE